MVAASTREDCRGQHARLEAGLQDVFNGSRLKSVIAEGMFEGQVDGGGLVLIEQFKDMAGLGTRLPGGLCQTREEVTGVAAQPEELLADGFDTPTETSRFMVCR